MKVKQTVRYARQLPKFIILVFRFRKTIHLIVALLRDKRIATWRKGIVGFGVGIMIAWIIFPLGEGILGIILPFVGFLLGIPADLLTDWTLFAIITIQLLKIFPTDIVAEQYENIFKK